MDVVSNRQGCASEWGSKLSIQLVGRGATLASRAPENSGNDGPERACLLVLGMHRSGTSALARVLSLLGCSLPSTLIGSNESNPTGHWESDVIRELNDELLDLAGRSWRDWRSIKPTFFDTLPVKGLAGKAASTIELEFGSSALFVLKDPRTSVLLPFWLRVLEVSKIVPLLLLPVRHPLEVASSLAARDHIDEGVAQLIWLRHLLASEYASRGMKRKFTTYDGLLDDWRGVAKSISNDLGVEWPRSTQTCDKQVREFLTPTLRHHKLEPRQLERDERLLTWSRDVYQIVLKWAEQGEMASDYERLDTIRSAFDTATRLLDPVITTADHASIERSARLIAEAQVETALRQLETARHELASAADEAAEMSQQRDIAEQRRAVAEEQIGSMANSLAELEADWRSQIALSEKLRLEHEQSHASLLSERTAELVNANRRIEMLEAQLVTQAEDHRKARELDRIHANSSIEVVCEERDEALSAMARSEQRSAVMAKQIGELNDRLAEAHRELAEFAKLQFEFDEQTAQLDAAERAVAEATQIATRARQIALTLQGQPWWTSLTVWPRSTRKLERQLARRDLFDTQQYLARYPDVAEGLLSPLVHYLRHGMDEDRIPT